MVIDAGNREKFNSFFQRIANFKPGTLTCPSGVIKLHTLLTADVYDDKGVFQEHREVKDRKITDQFVNLIVDSMQATSTVDRIFNFEYSVTGTDAESATNMALGSQTEATDGANYYKTVATITCSTKNVQFTFTASFSSGG